MLEVKIEMKKRDQLLIVISLLMALQVGVVMSFLPVPARPPPILPMVHAPAIPYIPGYPVIMPVFRNPVPVRPFPRPSGPSYRPRNFRGKRDLEKC